MSTLPTLTRQQLFTLMGLTLVWGFNWPIMKLGVADFPALSFRALSMLIGLPVLALVLVKRQLPFRVPRAYWRELLTLGFFNMFIWHTLVILAIPLLSSGRAAILGYTMPIFSAICGVWWFQSPLRARAWAGVAAAALGVTLLLWNEFSHFAGQPLAVLMVLFAAATWAYGTQRLRHTTIALPTLTLAFWMTLMTCILLCTLSVTLESSRWHMPSNVTWLAILYNALGVFAFAQAAWLTLARNLPPIASTLSVMFIPVLGVFTGALGLGEVLHWQDWSAVILMVVAIASVLWPASASDA